MLKVPVVEKYVFVRTFASFVAVKAWNQNTKKCEEEKLRWKESMKEDNEEHDPLEIQRNESQETVLSSSSRKNEKYSHLVERKGEHRTEKYVQQGKNIKYMHNIMDSIKSFILLCTRQLYYAY